MWAVKHFRHYLYGHCCHVFTDHEPLKSLLNTPHPSGKLAQWGLAVDLIIHYCPGKSNISADSLFRFPVDHPLMSKDSYVEDGDENSLVTTVVGHGNANKRKTSEPSTVVLVKLVEEEDSCHI